MAKVVFVLKLQYFEHVVRGIVTAGEDMMKGKRYHEKPKGQWIDDILQWLGDELRQLN